MGTRTATATFRAIFDSTIKNVLDASATGSPQVALGNSPSLVFTSGTEANQADRMWAQKGRTITSGGPENLDVYDFGSVDIGAGAGLDGLGQSLTLAEIAAILIFNRSTSGGNLLVGGIAAVTAWISMFVSQTSSEDDEILVIKPVGLIGFGAPTDPAYAVADTSNHLLKLDSSAGTCTFDIFILGRSA